MRQDNFPTGEKRPGWRHRLHGTDGQSLQSLMISHRQRLPPAPFPPPPMDTRHHRVPCTTGHQAPAVVMEFETIQSSQHKPNSPFTPPPSSGFKETHVRHTERMFGLGLKAWDHSHETQVAPAFSEARGASGSWGAGRPQIAMWSVPPPRVGYSDLLADHSEKNPGSEGI